MSRHIVVVSAGLGTPSTTKMLAGQLADAVVTQISARGEGTEISHIEVRHLASDLANMMVTGVPSDALKQAFDLLKQADGLVAVSPVFTASISRLFKMFFDAIDREILTNKPIVLAATAGTARHSLIVEYAMRPLFAYLRADAVPTAVFAATDDFAGSEELGERVLRAADQLASRVVAETGSVGGFKANDTDSGQLQAPKGFASLLKGHTGNRT